MKIIKFVVSIYCLLSLGLCMLILHKLNNDETVKRELYEKESQKMKVEYSQQQMLYESINSDGLNLSEILKPYLLENSKPILFCRFSSLNCSTCVDFCQNRLWENFKRSESNKQIMYIVSDFSDISKVGYEDIIDLKKKNLKLPAEQLNMPYFFILDNYIVKHLFIPDKNHPKLTEIYFREIKKRYFTNE